MTYPSGQERVLAVPLLGERSGGVGQVSTLLWRAMEDAWPGQSRLVTLQREGGGAPTFRQKLEFACALSARQVTRRVRWILFAHLGLARAERFVLPRWRSPFAVFLHGVEAWNRLPPAELAMLRSARLRLANSAFTARRVIEVNPEIGPIEVCPLALPAEAWPELPAGPADAPTVLIVGRMAAGERYKGHEQLIDAWPEVLARAPGAQLVIAGDGDDRPRLEARARAGGAGHHITFTGFVSPPELHRLYRGAAVFAMPSRHEGFGLVYLEAMAHGLPCIASVHDAAGEVVRDGETGLLVDSGDRQQLVGAILTLLANPDLRRKMGEAGRARWRQGFLFERFRDRVVSLLASAFESDSERERSA